MEQASLSSLIIKNRYLFRDNGFANGVSQIIFYLRGLFQHGI
jgi:hypothetical protein